MANTRLTTLGMPYDPHTAATRALQLVTRHYWATSDFFRGFHLRLSKSGPCGVDLWLAMHGINVCPARVPDDICSCWKYKRKCHFCFYEQFAVLFRSFPTFLDFLDGI